MSLLQAYELLQGNLVRFSPDATTKDVPTAVLVHGILGSKRNLNSFARMLVQVRMTWLFLVPAVFGLQQGCNKIK